MIHEKLSILVISLILFISCNDDVDPTDTLKFVEDFKESAVLSKPANGSVIPIVVRLNDRTNLSHRKVVFKANMGSFSGTDNKSEIVVDAEVYRDTITAIASLISPMRPGLATVSAEVVIEDKRGNYEILRQIQFTEVIADSLLVFTDDFSVENQFGSEIGISATLYNKQLGSLASSGFEVSFEDYYVRDTTIVGGSFRNLKTTSNQNSQVSCTYSPGFVPSGDGNDIFIRVRLSKQATIIQDVKFSVIETTK